MIHYYKLSTIDDKVEVLMADKDKQEYCKVVMLKGSYKALEGSVHYVRFSSQMQAIEAMMQFKRVDAVDTVPY